MKMKEVDPYIIALCGVLCDYASTVVGLSMGFVETHPEYHPITALVIFFAAVTVLKLTMPKGKWQIAPLFIAAFSFLGAVNNILVILGVFPGLVIPNILALG